MIDFKFLSCNIFTWNIIIFILISLSFISDVEQSAGDICRTLDGTTSLGNEEATPECESVQANEGTPLADEVPLLLG